MPKLFGLNITLSRLFKGDHSYAAPGEYIDIDDYDGDMRMGTMPRDGVNAIYKEYYEHMQIESARRSRYDVYDQMDLSDAASGVMDIYAEDASQPDDLTNNVLDFVSENENIVIALENLRENLELNERTVAIMRHLSKYGDSFYRLVYSARKGVLAMHFVHPSKVHRKEDKYKDLVGFHQDGRKFKKGESNVSHPWDFIHWRSRGKFDDTSYGTSIMHHSIRPWRHLILAEDRDMLARLIHRPDRLLFKIDVGAADEAQAYKVLNRYRKAVKQVQLIDPSSKNYDHQWNPITPIEDIFLAVRKDSVTDVTTLLGRPYASDVEGLNYYLDRFYNSTKTSKEFFGNIKGAAVAPIERQKKLTSQNIVYARQVNKLQMYYKQGLHQLCQIHLALLSKDATDPQFDFRENPFEIRMKRVTILDELERLEVMAIRSSVAQVLQGLQQGNELLKTDAWTEYILSEILGLTDEQVTTLTQDQAAADKDTLRQADLQGKAVELATPEPPPGAVAPAGKTPTEGRKKKLISNGDKQKIENVLKNNKPMRDLMAKGQLLFEKREGSYYPHEVPTEGIRKTEDCYEPEEDPDSSGKPANKA